LSAHICRVRNAFGALHIHRYNFSVMSIHAGYPTDGDAPSQHKQQTTPISQFYSKQYHNNDNKNNKMSASSTIINNKKSPSTPLRQTYFASPAEANVANRTVLPGILHGPEYSRMKTAFKSHRVEFLDAKVFDERIERFVELERLRALPGECMNLFFPQFTMNMYSFDSFTPRFYSSTSSPHP
jgi:hypothetical protein